MKLITLLLALWIYSGATYAGNDKEIAGIANSASKGDQKSINRLVRLAKDDKYAAKILGVMYFKGLGVQKDKEKAELYFEISANLGDKESINFLKKLHPDKVYKFNPETTIGTSEKEERSPALENLDAKFVWRPFKEPAGKREGSGTGFAINSDGVFITNYHVIDGCNSLVIDYINKKSYAKILATSKASDLAVLSVEQNIPYFLSIREKSANIGEKASVGGYPVYDNFKFSEGIVAAKPPGKTHIQISSTVTSGNSGSPVVDKSSNVIGVISFVVAAGKNAELGVIGSDYNFAVDITKLKEVLTANSIKYSIKNNSNNISTENIVRILEKTTAKIECY